MRLKYSFSRALLMLFIPWLVSSCTQAQVTDGGDKGGSGSSVAAASACPVARVVAVEGKALDKVSRLPAEMVAYRDVGLYPRVAGFVKWLGVDRGSSVKRGQLIATLEAPELVAQKDQAAQTAQAEAISQQEAGRKWRAARAQAVEAKAKQESDDLTYRRMKEASIAYPGAVVGNELDVARQAAEASHAHALAAVELEEAAKAEMKAAQVRTRAAENSAQALKQMESYLNICAPFDGVVTERNVDEGSFVSAPTGTGNNGSPMLRVQQISKLRIVVAVPESDTAAIEPGKTVKFTVSAFGKRIFQGTIQRIGHALDRKTRTMPVELDVANDRRELEPGMYPEVWWPSHKKQTSLFVPLSCVVTNTERRFVVRVKDGTADWVDVKTGATMDDLIEVEGSLSAGDHVVVKASDQLRPGARVTPRP